MKRIFMASVIIVLGIQLIPVSRTNPEVVSDFDGPAEVKAILRKSCYDCHSNETDWPWYSHVAPVSWLITHHVNDGRRHLNLSDWVPLKEMKWVRREMYEEVNEGKMPPASYLLMHSGAKVSEDELAILKDWAGE